MSKDEIILELIEALRPLAILDPTAWDCNMARWIMNARSVIKKAEREQIP